MLRRNLFLVDIIFKETMANSDRIKNLKKLSLLELKDTLHRENLLLNNKALIKKLPDKGKSIKIFRDRVQEEIEFRKSIGSLEESMTKLKVGQNVEMVKDKHIEYICEKENTEGSTRFMPFCSLKTTHITKPGSKIKEVLEEFNYSNKPTKLIALPESMCLLNQQAKRVEEEQIRSRHRRAMEKLQAEEDIEDGTEEESDKSEGNFEEIT